MKSLSFAASAVAAAIVSIALIGCGSSAPSAATDSQGSKTGSSTGSEQGKAATEAIPGTSGPSELLGHAGQVNAVAISRDGKRIASGGDDKTVRVWNPTTGKEVKLFDGHTGAVTDVAFDPEGDRVASSSSDGTVRVWNVESGKEVFCFRGHRGGPIRAIAFAPDGKRIASGGQDRQVRVWEAANGNPILAVPAYGDMGPLTVDISPNGQQLLVGSSDGSVRLWDLENAKEIRRLDGIRSCFAGDGGVLFAGRMKSGAQNINWVKLWNPVTGAESELDRFEGLAGLVWSLAASPDGRRALAGSRAGIVRTFDLHDRKREFGLLKRHDGQVSGLAVFPDGRRVVSCAQGDAIVRIWAMPD